MSELRRYRLELEALPGDSRPPLERLAAVRRFAAARGLRCIRVDQMPVEGARGLAPLPRASNATSADASGGTGDR